MNVRERVNSILLVMKEDKHTTRNFNENMEERLLFHLFFLKNEEDQSVKVKDFEEIDFAEGEKRLEGGESGSKPIFNGRRAVNLVFYSYMSDSMKEVRIYGN